MEFACEKDSLFEKWCVASKVNTFKQLKELILMEEFKNCISTEMTLASYLSMGKTDPV